MDIWGHCSDCRTWFPCPTWFDRGAPHPACPSCGAEPSAIENRAHGHIVPAEIRLDEADARVLVGATPSDLWLG